MIDLLSLGLTHAIMLLAVWRLLRRPDLDADAALGRPPAPWGGRPDA